jgi:hypothetical protein
VVIFGTESLLSEITEHSYSVVQFIPETFLTFSPIFDRMPYPSAHAMNSSIVVVPYPIHPAAAAAAAAAAATTICVWCSG